MRLTVCFLLLMLQLWAGTVPERDAGGGPLWRLVHPSAKALIGVDWARVRDTPLGAWVQKSWIGDLVGESAVEFLRDVDSLLISSPGAAATAEDPPLLIAVYGKFKFDRLMSVFAQSGMQPQLFGSVTVFAKPKTAESEPVFALLSTRLVLIGDRRSILTAIERANVEAGVEPALVTRGRELAHVYDCWAAIRDSSSMQNFLFAGLAGLATSPDSTGFEAGISVSDGLRLELKLGVRDEHSARALRAKLEAMLKGIPKQSDGFAGLMARMRISADTEAVHLTLRMNSEETAANFRAKPVPKRVIRIEGLDEGTREVPIGAK